MCYSAKRRSKNISSDTPAIGDFLPNGSYNMNGNGMETAYTNGGYNGITGEFSHDTTFDLELDDPGPHREMAIDCPEDFIARIKSPPRFPPSNSTPRPVKTQSQTKDKKNSQTSLNSGSSNRRQNSSNSGKYSPSPGQSQRVQPTPQELERLQHHKDELKVRTRT